MLLPNQLESVCAVKGHICDKPGHRVACLLCHPSTPEAIITDKCHSGGHQWKWDSVLARDLTCPDYSDGSLSA